MARIKLLYVKSYQDRHGKVRHYFRRKGLPPVALPGVPGSPEFLEAYQLANSGEVKIAHPTSNRFADRTFGAAVQAYFQSVSFTNKKLRTQKTYRTALGPLVDQHGTRSLAGFSAARTEAIIAEIGKTKPAMANLTKAALARVFKHAKKLGWCTENPTTGIESFRGGEHHTWTDAELVQFENRWPVGTRERLAYALLLYTDQRVGDAAKMHRSDITKGMIRLAAQEKTGTTLMIPIHPALQRALDAYPAKGLTLIGHVNGRPLSAAGLSRVIERAAKKAGLPAGLGVPKEKRCRAHGLRKALQRKLAESGATTKQMQAVSGHTTLEQVERYSRRANQELLARGAMALIPDTNEA